MKLSKKVCFRLKNVLSKYCLMAFALLGVLNVLCYGICATDYLDNEVIITKHSDGTKTTTTVSEISKNTPPVDCSAFLPSSISSESASLRSITDLDGRTLISPPDSRIGVLECGFDSNPSSPGIDVYIYSSASLQCYDIIISCAHGLWIPEYNSLPCDGWASEITFYAGESAPNVYIASASYSSASISMNFVNNSYYDDSDSSNYFAFDWDWSIIQLSTDIGSTCGWFGIHSCGNSELGLNIDLLGYPGDKTPGSPWRPAGEITAMTQINMFDTSAFIYSGASGGPIVYSNKVYGIATVKTNYGSGGTRMYSGLISLITTAKAESAERWEEE